jgi:hypothetical protein
MRWPIVAIATAAIATVIGAWSTVGVSARQKATAPVSPTFYRDVLPILQTHCQGCHRPAIADENGLIAPMSLMTYEDARPWAQSMLRRVQAHEMPPWFASAQTHGVFDSERGLSDAQIGVIAGWVRGGAPGGRLEDAPPPPARPPSHAEKGWVLGVPDVSIVGEPTTIPDDQTDDLTQHEVGQIPEELWVQGVEFRAASPAVHHMCATAILHASTGAAEPEISLGCAAPGVEPRMLPDGYALLLPKGATVQLEVHGRKNAGPHTAVRYQSAVGLTLANGPIRHRVRFSAISNSTFEIPPRAESWPVGATRLFDKDTLILALWPHGHFRAVAASYTAVYPNGRRELLLDVPRFDRDWQEVYRYKEPKRIPAGTRIDVAYRYDNSAARGVKRGFDAAKAVTFGPRANDEMMIGFIEYTDAAATTDARGTVDTSFTAGGPLVDAADRDLWWRGTVSLPSSNDKVRVLFPRFELSEASAPLERMAPGAVVSSSLSAAMKLRTEVELDFGAVKILPGNVAKDFAGLYGLWLKKSADGWRLVFTNEPDVLGSQWNPKATVAEAPIRYERTGSGTQRFAATLEDQPGGGRLLLTWGPHRWTADFTTKQETPSF